MSSFAILDLCLIGVLILLSATFSSIDMSYAVINKRRVEKAAQGGSKHAKRALKYANDYDSTIITVLFGNSLVNILASSLGAALSKQAPFNENTSLSAMIIEFSMLLIILTFGEIFPKVLAKIYSYRIVMMTAYFVAVCQILFFPFVKLASIIAKKLTRQIFKKLPEESEAPSDDELQTMVDAIEEEGFIDEDTSELIHNSIEFKDTVAYEIMTPRVRIEAIEYGTDLSKFLATTSYTHSRIPVYKKDLDHIVGYIPLKTLQKAVLNQKKLVYEDLMVEMLAVPFTMEISTILALMKSNHHHIVLVKDEYGGTDGILTMEDILEELVGEIWDESEDIAVDIVPTKKRNQFIVKGTTDIQEFMERFRLRDEEEDTDYETVSGWINDHLGRFAHPGDHYDFQRVSLKVKKASPYTVDEIIVTYHPRKKI